MTVDLKPRVTALEPPYPAALQAQFDAMMRGAPPLLLFRTVARNPRVLERMLAASLLDRGSIRLRSRELIILRTCARCGSEYEWGVHVAAFAEKAGFTDAQLRSIAHGGPQDPVWEREDRLVLGLADRLHDTSTVDDGAWWELTGYFVEEQLIELVMLAGLYHAVSYLANACGVPPEDFAARFPERG